MSGTRTEVKYGINVILAIGFLVAFIVMVFLLIVEARVLNKRLQELNTSANEINDEVKKITTYFG